MARVRGAAGASNRSASKRLRASVSIALALHFPAFAGKGEARRYKLGHPTECAVTNASGYPERIVCLTEETTEALYLLGEDARIVGISGFTVRPPRARRVNPLVSAFTSAKIERIIRLRPNIMPGLS